MALPVDARVTFADERRAAGIDEVLDALDADLIGLVPVKKKVQEVAALLLVDLAGYKDRMDGFFGSNPGMSSRIAHHLDFAAYEEGELAAIARLMLNQTSYYLSAEAEETFRRYITRQMDEPRFANARSVRNELERARLRHAHRLTSEPDRSWTRDDLMRIEPVDIAAGHAELLAEPQQF